MVQKSSNLQLIRLIVNLSLTWLGIKRGSFSDVKMVKGSDICKKWKLQIGEKYQINAKLACWFRLIDVSKLPVGVNGCLSLCPSPATDWWPVHAVICLSPYGSWDWLLPPCDKDKKKRMDGFWCIYSNSMAS